MSNVTWIQKKHENALLEKFSVIISIFVLLLFSQNNLFSCFKTKKDENVFSLKNYFFYEKRKNIKPTITEKIN